MNKLKKSMALLSLVGAINVSAMYNENDVYDLREDTAYCQPTTREDILVRNLNSYSFRERFFIRSLVNDLNDKTMAIVVVDKSRLPLLGYLVMPRGFEPVSSNELNLIGYIRNENNTISSYSVCEKFDDYGRSIVFFSQVAVGFNDSIFNRLAEFAQARKAAREQYRRENELIETGNVERLAREGVADFGVNLANAGTSLLNGNFSGALSSLASSAAGAWNAISNGLTYCFRRLSDLCRRNAR